MQTEGYSDAGRVNTISSCDIVSVVIVHEDANDLDRVYVAGTYARRAFAERQAANVQTAKPGATINIVDTFLDAQATFYPGFSIHARA